MPHSVPEGLRDAQRGLQSSAEALWAQRACLCTRLDHQLPIKAIISIGTPRLAECDYGTDTRLDAGSNQAHVARLVALSTGQTAAGLYLKLASLRVLFTPPHSNSLDNYQDSPGRELRRDGVHFPPR